MLDYTQESSAFKVISNYWIIKFLILLISCGLRNNCIMSLSSAPYSHLIESKRVLKLHGVLPTVGGKSRSSLTVSGLCSGTG